MSATWHGHFNFVKLLVEDGAYINQQDMKNRFTALMKAVFHKEDASILKYLLGRGADKDVRCLCKDKDCFGLRLR